MAEMTDRTADAPSRRFPPYPVYRDSGVEWLGEVPTHWDVRRLKTMASVQLSNVDKHTEEGQVPVRLCNYVDVYYSDLVTPEGEFMNATATPNQVRRFLLRAGDVLITKDSESWNDIAVPALVAEDLTDVLCGYHLAQIKPGPDLDGRFLARQFSAIGTRDQFHVAANGITRFGLGGDAIRTGLFPIAPIEEQRAIANFLDRETAKIDGLVARKERLIELLREKRTALITRAVTRGLDPNVPMKDSGVEWLGEIPAHWDVKRLWHLTPSERKIMYGIVLPGPDVDAGVPIVKGGDVAGSRLKLETLSKTTFEIESRYIRSRLAGGDLVYAIRGSIGEVEIVPEELDGANLTQDAARVAYSQTTHGSWLMYALRSRVVFSQLEAGALGATIKGINIRDLKRALIPVPPKCEQERIASFLDIQTDRFNALSAKVQAAINHLNEFRTALISAAVTGKIDVRATSAEASAGQGGTR